MASKEKDRQTIVHKTQHSKIKIKQHDPTKLGVISTAPEGIAVRT